MTWTWWVQLSVSWTPPVPLVALIAMLTVASWSVGGGRRCCSEWLLPQIGDHSHGNGSEGRVRSIGAILEPPSLLPFNTFTPVMEVKPPGFRPIPGMNEGAPVRKKPFRPLCGNGPLFWIGGFCFSRGHSHLIFVPLARNLFISY